MIKKWFFVGLLLTAFLGCNSTEKTSNSQDTYTDVEIVGAMKNVMWKGELAGIINLDSISHKKGLYGLGPESFLTGELLINNGQVYVSIVLSDSTMVVEKNDNVSAPFFVYANVNEWQEINLPEAIKSIKDLEIFVDEKTKDQKRPFALKLSGQIINGIIHIQNLPKGSKVSSPKEAHQGQVNYNLGKEDVEIVGFFSTEHQGIFTHHDSFLHLHLITKDESKMGHLDKVEFDKMKLYLPKK